MTADNLYKIKYDKKGIKSYLFATENWYYQVTPFLYYGSGNMLYYFQVLFDDKGNLDEEDARYEQILGEENLSVSDESLKVYRSYLQKNIALPCELTGIEDFKWEEYYIFGPGDKKKYEELKKTKPSFTDIYTFISFDDQIDDSEGLMVKVRRISDNKQFVLPLADLKVTDESLPNYQLIDDYSVWHVNY